jgi:ABC-type dipeptide/oligopeptide/nickel transport system permease component
VTLSFATMVILINLLTDLVYSVLDPRVTLD